MTQSDLIPVLLQQQEEADPPDDIMAEDKTGVLRAGFLVKRVSLSDRAVER